MVIKNNKELFLFDIQKQEVLIKNGNAVFNTNELFEGKRRDVYIIIFSGKMGAKQFIDNKLILIPPYSTLFIGPNRITHFVNEIQSGTHILMFSSLFYNRNYEDARKLASIPVFHNFAPIYLLTPPQESVNYCKNLAFLLYQVHENFESQVNQDLAHNIIEQILIMSSLYSYKSIGFGPKESVDGKLSLDFKALLDKHVMMQKTVRFYASKLNVTERRLNKATQVTLSMNAKDVIIKKILEEAEWKLVYSKESVKEISSSLGFAEENNFSSFFKKHKKISPTAFRKNMLSDAIL